MLTFWKKIGLLNILLLPFSFLYYIGYLINYYIIQKPKRVNAKVICIGNLTVGGSGKTPYAIYLYHQLLEQGVSNKISKDEIAFISRGYKGSISSSKSVHKVSFSDNYKLVGDEPLLLAEVAKTYICKNRYLAAKRAVSEGAKIIIMDDGLQNNTIHKDEVILVFDKVNGFGNKLLLPAGPMREPCCIRKKSIDKIVVISSSSDNASNKGSQLDSRAFSSFKSCYKNIEIINLKSRILNIDEILKAVSTLNKNKAKTNVILLTAIANSNRIIQMLEKEGVGINKHIELKDHSEFSSEILKEMQKLSENNHIILTTKKDIVRIPKKYHNLFTVLEYQLMKN